MKLIPFTCLVATLCLLTWLTRAYGQNERIEDRAAIRDINIGINGLYKLGAWAPVRVTLVAGEESLEGLLRVTVPDGDGQPCVYESNGYTVGAGQEQHVWTYVKPGRADFPLTVEFVERKGVTHRKTVPARDVPDAHFSSESIVISIGKDPDVDAALRLRARPDREQWFHQTIRDVHDLPDHLLGYDGVNVVVLTASDVERLAQLTDKQREAITSWIRLGGSVVITASTDASQWEGGSHPFDSLLPGRVESVTTQRQMTGIEQFANATTPVGSLAAQVPVAVMTDVDGRVEVFEGLGARRPAIVHGAVGLGRTVFVAFDLSSDPFTTWQDRPRLVVKLIELALRGESDDEPLGELDPGQALSLGFDDLGGQMRTALDRFPGVRLVPFSITASLVAVYILMVGPLDYWVLRRWRRPGWTWFTFSASVVGFTGLAILLSYLWKGDTIRVNQATIVDIDIHSGTVRGTSWSHVFSPRSQEFQLDTVVTPQSVAVNDLQRTINWQGLPGEGFGGMSSGLKSTALSQPYRVQVDTRPADKAHVFLADYPIAVWSSRSLISQWWGRASLPLETNLEEGVERQLTGSVPNPFPFGLQDVHLMYDRWAYAIGSIGAGDTIEMDGRSIIDIQTLLTRRRVVNGRNLMTPWDVEHSDVEMILRMMMFYGASKGRSYTNLRHSHQSFIDLSDHLKLDRAVLVGRSQQPAAQTTFNGEPAPAELQQNWTYYRLLFPVRTKG